MTNNDAISILLTGKALEFIALDSENNIESIRRFEPKDVSLFMKQASGTILQYSQ